MIMVKDCAFQDGSYPCGYEDEGELPNCDFCRKIRKAGIKEVVEWIKEQNDFGANSLPYWVMNKKVLEAKLLEWGI